MDSGSKITLILPYMVLPNSSHTSTLLMTCGLRDIREVPTIVIRLGDGKKEWTILAGIIPELPVPLLVGRDCRFLENRDFNPIKDTQPLIYMTTIYRNFFT